MHIGVDPIEGKIQSRMTTSSLVTDFFSSPLDQVSQTLNN